MDHTLVKRYVNVAYVEGATIKAQRLAAGAMSAQTLMDRVHAITGIRISLSRWYRLEDCAEFPVTNDILAALQQILK